MPVSITDVAQRAGVSRGTVSQVLNGNAEARIADSTQERVRQAAADLGYHPNRFARSLGRRTDTLGLVLSRLGNPFFLHIMETLEERALESGYQMLLDAPPSRPESGDQPAKLRGWPVDGVLMWAWATESVAEYLDTRAVGLPVVYLGGQPRPDHSDSVYFDTYAGARMAMEHLVRAGHRRIAYVFPYSWVMTQPDEARRRAYQEVCQEAGLPIQLIQMGRPEETRQAGFETGMALAAMPGTERPQAALCFNDVVAQGVLFGLRRGGLRVPEDMAIVGFDGISEGQYLDVPLTTVRLPAAPFCQEALRLLLRRICEGQDAPPEQVRVAPELVLGGTA